MRQVNNPISLCPLPPEVSSKWQIRGSKRVPGSFDLMWHVGNIYLYALRKASVESFLTSVTSRWQWCTLLDEFHDTSTQCKMLVVKVDTPNSLCSTQLAISETERFIVHDNMQDPNRFCSSSCGSLHPAFFLGGGERGGAESFSKPVYYLTDIELTSCKYLLPNMTLRRRKPPLQFPWPFYSKALWAAV